MTQCRIGGISPNAKTELDSSSRIDTIPPCDGQTEGRTDGQTDRQTDTHATTAYIALA